MPDQAAALLAHLREHIRTCYTCDPRIGRYCSTARPDVDRLYELRRDEVYAARLAGRAGR